MRILKNAAAQIGVEGAPKGAKRESESPPPASRRSVLEQLSTAAQEALKALPKNMKRR
jgi:hypothetical protein